MATSLRVCCGCARACLYAISSGLLYLHHHLQRTTRHVLRNRTGALDRRDLVLAVHAQLGDQGDHIVADRIVELEAFRKRVSTVDLNSTMMPIHQLHCRRLPGHIWASGPLSLCQSSH